MINDSKFNEQQWLQVYRLYVASFESKSIEPRRARLQKVSMLLITVIKLYLYEIY
jgi:hypothetical protein